MGETAEGGDSERSAPELGLGLPTAAPSPARAASAYQIGERIADRYEIRSELGRGGFGEVYRVLDLSHGQERALKLQHVDGSASAIDALRDEFAMLATLSHPNLAGVHDFGYASERLAYFTQDLVKGEALHRIPFDLNTDAGIDLIAQLCRALGYLHARGILHRDVKPSNILVDRETGKLTLLDFGVAKALGQSSSLAMVGSFGFMAPESITGGALDARVDLYALGVTLYSLIARTVPFVGTKEQVLYAHVFSPPPPLPRSTPRAIAQLISRLLAKEPAERFASTSEVLVALVTATGRENRDDPADALASYVLSAGPVAVEAARDEIRNVFTADEACREVVVIYGAAGTGKTRLLRELRYRFQIMGWQCQGLEQRDDGAIGDIASDVAKLIGNTEVLEALSSDDRRDLSGLLPDLRKTVRASRLVIDPEALRTRQIKALARAIAVRCRDVPAVLTIDNLQRGSVGELKTLVRLIVECQRLGARCHFLLGSRPSPEQEPRLATMLGGHGLRRIDIPLLTPSATTRLVRTMFGHVDLVRSTALWKEMRRTPRTPLFVQESLRLAIDEGRLVRVDGDWQRRDELVARPMEEVLSLRVHHLSRAAQKTAIALAVIGQPARRREAARVAGMSAQRLTDPLGELLRSGIAEEHDDSDGVPVHAMHERFVQTVRKDADPKVLAACHRRAARWLLRGRPVDHRALGRAADHLCQSSEPEAAAALFDRDAAAADVAGRPDTATQLIGRAIEITAADAHSYGGLLLAQHDHARRAGLRGVAIAALEMLAAAIARTPPASTTGADETDIGLELALRQADVEIEEAQPARARERLLAAIERASRPGHGAIDEDVSGAPRTQRSTVGSRARLRLAIIEDRFGSPQKALPLYERAGEAASAIRDSRTEAQAFLGAAHAAMLSANLATAEVLGEKACRAAEALGDPGLESEALRSLSNAQREAGKPAVAMRNIRKAVRRARVTGSPELEAKALNNLGVGAHWLGEVAECVTAYRRAALLKERAGAVLSALVTENNLAAVLAAIGHGDEAKSRLEGIVRSQAAQQTPALMVSATANLGDIAAGRELLHEAEAHYQTACALCDREQLTQVRGHPLAGLARVRIMRAGPGDMEAAEAHAAELARLAEQLPLEEGRCQTTWAMLADALGDSLSALEHAQRAVKTRGASAPLWAMWGAELDAQWIVAVIAHRLGQTELAARAGQLAGDAVDRLAVQLTEEGAMERFLDVRLLHRAIVERSLDVPPGWTWPPIHNP